MKSCFSKLLVLTAFLLDAQPVQAALQVGDAAPKLQVGSWLQGEAVKEFEGDKVYIIEFWATWCGPCMASIPHLNDLHERFKDRGLVVIGQNVLERDDSLVAPFVKSMAGKMNYRVAADDKTGGGNGRMAQAWLAAAEQNGIPCAFIVNKKGRLVFIGHPNSLKAAELETLLAEPSSVVKGPTVAPPGNKARAPSPKAMELARKAETEIRARQWDQADATLAELQEILPENFREIGGLLNLDLLIAQEKSNDALQLAQLMGEDFKGNPAVQNAIASRLAQPLKENAPLLAAAEKIATPISQAPGGPQANALATLARIAWLRGQKPRAVEIQTQAVASASKNDAPRQQAALEAYQQGRLPEPDRAGKPR
jgi:thiol-disulfide isomerase/thioredoxin